jgi:hypothetical protein
MLIKKIVSSDGRFKIKVAVEGIIWEAKIDDTEKVVVGDDQICYLMSRGFSELNVLLPGHSFKRFQD